MNLKITVAAVALTGASVLLSGCIFDKQEEVKKDTVLVPATPSPVVMMEEQTETASPSTATSPMMAATDTKNVKSFELEAGSFYYKPNEMRVKKGDTVTVIIKSVDMMHDFVIDELAVKMPITKSGDTNSVEFVASKAGTFTFYCSVGQHRAHGQVGTLIVE